MAMNMPNFDSFKLYENEHTAGPRWRTWLDRFENMLLCLNVEEDARRKAMLLHYCGDEVYNIFSTFTDAQKGLNADNEYETIEMDFKVLTVIMLAATSCFMISLAQGSDAPVHCNDEWCEAFCSFRHNQKTNEKLDFMEDCYEHKQAEVAADLNTVDTVKGCDHWCQNVYEAWGDGVNPVIRNCIAGNAPANCEDDEGCKKWCIPLMNTAKDPVFDFMKTCFFGNLAPSDCNDEKVFADLCVAMDKLREHDSTLVEECVAAGED